MTRVGMKPIVPAGICGPLPVKPHIRVRRIRRAPTRGCGFPGRARVIPPLVTSDLARGWEPVT
ncbi:MAG: hypothetical protein QOE48_5561 [Mycobacterium sp.]|jgi:hypothetical protein|nr:hypothetical protein [Mycobacterium sp.]